MQPRNPRAHGAHDTPATNQRPEGHRGLADQDDPEWDVKSCAEETLGIEQHGNDAHGLLRIVAERKKLSTAGGVERMKAHETVSTSSNAKKKPSKGERTIAAAVIPRPFQTIAPSPALVTPAPASPPIRAWELLEGSPSHQVIKFQTIAPMSAPNITAASTTSAATIPVPTVCAT